MPAPTSIVDLSTTAASNYPAGSELPSILDDSIRALSSVVKYNVSKGSDIASSATITIPTQGSYFVVTGTTSITAISNTNAFDGREVTLKFSGALTFTHGAGLILPGAANITTVAGDVAKVVYESTGVWRCTSYTKASGTYASLGANTFTGTQKWAKGADVASANALALGTDGNYFDITGTTAITSINTVGVGTWVMLQFDATLTLTHHATNLILPTNYSFGTLAGDHAIFVEYATGQWRCVSYNRISGDSINPSTKSQDFRLSLTTGLPVTTADVTAATTIYAVPKTGVQISLYNATIGGFITHITSEFSLALGTLTSGKPYDIFCYSNAGVPTLEALVWTNDTTRATALAYQYGILVKSGDATRRYMGTFYTTSTTTTEDSAAKRFLYNYYHRVKRPLLKTDSTASWTYTTGSYRQANNAAANQVEAIQGVAEDAVFIDARNTTSISASFSSCPAGIGLDSTSASSHTRLSTCSAVSGAATGWSIAEYRSIPSAGYHKYVWLETGAANTTFVGGSAGSGISGEVMA